MCPAGLDWRRYRWPVVTEERVQDRIGDTNTAEAAAIRTDVPVCLTPAEGAVHNVDRVSLVLAEDTYRCATRKHALGQWLSKATVMPGSRDTAKIVSVDFQHALTMP